MLTVEQAKELKNILHLYDSSKEGSRQADAAWVALKMKIDSLTVENVATRISPVIGIIRSMEMTHEEAVQRILKALE